MHVEQTNNKFLSMHHVLQKKGLIAGSIVMKEIIAFSFNLTTRERPDPSCPAARKRFGKPGTGPMTGFPSGTEKERFIGIYYMYIYIYLDAFV